MKKKLATSISDLARALGVNRNTVASWVAQGAPRRTDGGFDVEAVRAWRQQQQVNAAAARAASRGEPVEDAELRSVALQYRRLKAARVAFELRREQGRYIAFEQYEADLVQRARAFRAMLLAVANTFAQQHPEATEEQVRTIETLHRDVLRQAYERRTLTAPAPRDADDNEQAAGDVGHDEEHEHQAGDGPAGLTHDDGEPAQPAR